MSGGAIWSWRETEEAVEEMTINSMKNRSDRSHYGWNTASLLYIRQTIESTWRRLSRRNCSSLAFGYDRNALTSKLPLWSYCCAGGSAAKASGYLSAEEKIWLQPSGYTEAWKPDHAKYHEEMAKLAERKRRLRRGRKRRRARRGIEGETAAMSRKWRGQTEKMHIIWRRKTLTSIRKWREICSQ